MIKRTIYIALAALLAGVTPAFPQSKAQNDLSLKTIVVDAGHGGKDVGTMSADKKTYEKTLTLSISRKFAEKVRAAYPGMKVVMTRDKDVFVPLNTRAKIASDAGANLFISIHINASARSKSVNGFSAYILGPSQKSKYDSYEVNLEVCKRENSVIYLEDDYSTTYKDFDDSPESQIFMQLMQQAFREQSLAFAEKVSDGMADGPFSKNWGVMQGNFAVLRQASMPAVLLEFGFMTNDSDLKTLRSEEQIGKMVDKLFNSFCEYKRVYDQSVSISGEGKTENGSSTATKPAAAATAQTDQDTKPQVTPETKDAAAAGVEPAVYYGTQVLASSKKMDPADKYFKGFACKPVKVGTLYKYVLGPETDITTAAKTHKEIKNFFPDSFFVKVENGEISREKTPVF